MRVIYNKIILSAGDMSQATLTSTSIPLEQMFGCSIQATFTGAPVGSLKLQVSNDQVSWCDLPSPTAISAAGCAMFNVSDTMYLFIRAVYTKTSGTGSLTIGAVGKGI